jgi:predicted transcriptional regulator
MSTFYDILFEISSENRHQILMELKSGGETVSRIADGMEISLTEASRHFSRLANVGLIEKNVDGRFTLTFFGSLALRQLNALRFSSKHRDYFSYRDLSLLPSQFVNRLHELEESQPNYSRRSNIMLVSNNVARIVLESEKYVFSLIDQEIMELVLYTSPDEGTAELFQEAVRRGVNFKVLVPDTFDPEEVHEDTLEMYAALFKKGNLDYRAVPSVDVFIHSSEKEVSILSFPDKDGRFDYLGFEAVDESTLNWCRDVFQSYWGRSKPLNLF